jgi:hypothetical protein
MKASRIKSIFAYLKKTLQDSRMGIFTIIGILLINFSIKEISKDVFSLVIVVIWTLLLILVGLIGVSNLRQRHKNNQPILIVDDVSTFFKGVTAVFVFGFLITGYFTGAMVAIKWGYSSLSDPQIDRASAVWIVCPLIGVIGLLLFGFRSQFRCLYGISEVVAGLVVAQSQVLAIAPGIALLNSAVLLPLLTAAVYLVVRGLDNMKEGWTGVKPDMAVRFVKRKFVRQPAVS